MNTLVLYATKHGAAREIAKRIAGKMNGATLHDLKQGNIPSLAGFDSVIIGSSLYAGSIRKEAKEFLSQNEAVLQSKKLGLFLSGIGEDKDNQLFGSVFSPEILKAAKATGHMGGIFDPKKAGVMERFIMKVVTKQSRYVNTIDDNKIAQFAEVMKSN